MTDFLDSDTIGSATAPSVSDVLYADADTVGLVTTPTATDTLAAVESSTVDGTTTVISGEQVTTNLTSKDYSGSALTQAVTYDTTYTFAGEAGYLDNDNGVL